MEFPISFSFEGGHPIEYIIWMDNNQYGLNDVGLVYFEKLK